MKHLQRLLFLAAISFAVFSCQKEYSSENNPSNSNASSQWSFTEGSAQFKGPVDTVAVDTLGAYKFLTLNGHSTDNKDQITLQVFGAELKAGTYKTPFSLFAYLRNGVSLYQTNQTAIDSFTIIITKLDSTGIIGTFSGKAWDSTKTYKIIVDGKFSSVFKRTTPVIPVVTDSGNVVIWSKAGCGGGTSTSPISVSIGTHSGQITTFSATEPTACDSTGGFSIKLPVGTYPIVAKCGVDSVTGTVTVLKNGCTKVNISLTGTPAVTDYFPTTPNSNWSYIYENGTPADTLYTLSTGVTGTIAGQTGVFSLFTNQNSYSKDSSLYKKGNNTYYTYVPAEKIDSNGIDVPAYTYTFLKDNVAVGTTFTDGPIPCTLQNTQGNINLNTTIVDTGAIATISGISYTSIIKVKTIYSFTVLGSSNIFYEAEQWFAKGVGLIKLTEYYNAPFTTPDEVLDITRSKVY